MNILVVDDAPDMRLIIKHFLIKLSHTVDIAIDGEDAWEMLMKKDYQVVISDWMMPKVNGLELCKKVRDYNFSKYIYFILLTGMSGKESLMNGIKAGADDFVNKPVDADELDIRLRSAKRVLELEQSLELKNEALKEAHRHINDDLINAETTQLSLLPEPIDSDQVKSAWYYKPAIYVGGDTFNYFKPSEDFLVFFSIDISGHGISSAMLSMSLQASLAYKRGLYGSPINRENVKDIPAVFAKNLNQMVCDVSSDHYLTMVFGIIDFKEKDIHYVQAGHPHPIWYDNAKDSLAPIEINGFPVGLVDSAEFETQYKRYEPGDKFIIYSDGISENESALAGGILESDNLYNHFEKIKNQSPDAMIETISTTWLTEEQIKELPDDLSLLIFEFK